MENVQRVITSNNGITWHIARIELVFLILIIVAIAAIIDIARNKFDGFKNVIWLIISLFIPFGGVFYFLIGRKQRINA
jgi:hypothetical protein